MTEPHASAMWTRGWLEFADLSFHPRAEGGEPKGPHIFGRALGFLFQPDSQVIGVVDEPPRGIVARRGYIELETRRFFPEGSAARPSPPFVEGFMSVEEGGGFYPSGQVVSVPSWYVKGDDRP